MSLLTHELHDSCLFSAGVLHETPDEGLDGLEAEGARLVTEVAESWTQQYQHTIRIPSALTPPARMLGDKQKGSYRYTCLFSRPEVDVPVPNDVLRVHFSLQPAQKTENGSMPRLFYHFDEGDLTHEWALERAQPDLSKKSYCDRIFQAVSGQQVHSFGDGSFEGFLNRILDEKGKVRDRGPNLATEFEETRLEPPPAYSEASGSIYSDSDEEEQEVFVAPTTVQNTMGIPVKSPGRKTTKLAPKSEMTLAMENCLKLASLPCNDKTEPPTLSALLSNIFDAADEMGQGQLPHYEVALLLGATLPGLGLEVWDIHLLLTFAQENDDGYVECKPFVQSAPEIVQELRNRRKAFLNRGLPGAEVSLEMVQHCFGDEVSETAANLMRVFEQCSIDEPADAQFVKVEQEEDVSKRRRSACKGSKEVSARASMQAVPRKSFSASNADELIELSSPYEDMEERTLQGLKRSLCRDCILSRPERISPQEAQRLMQMLPEDQEGFIHIDKFLEHLELLRHGALTNALVESDIPALRTQIVLNLRRLGLDEDGRVKLWVLKDALLRSDQLCLSRMQIHVLMCMAKAANLDGDVDGAEFLGICCTYIPHMFNAVAFAEIATRLAEEQANAARRAEQAELAALAKSTIGPGGEEKEQEEKKPEVDRETVEKTLIQVFSLLENASGNKAKPDTILKCMYSNDAQIASCQLEDHEIVGFLAEMNPDDDGVVAYVDHVRTWMPIIFDLRKHPLLTLYMKADAMEALEIPQPDLADLELNFPLIPHSNVPRRRAHSMRRSSHSGELSRRPTNERRDSKDYTKDGRQGSKMVGRYSSSQQEKAKLSVNPGGGNSFGSGMLVRKTSITSSRRPTIQATISDTPKEPPPGRGYERRKQRLLAGEQDLTGFEPPPEIGIWPNSC